MGCGFRALPFQGVCLGWPAGDAVIRDFEHHTVYSFQTPNIPSHRAGHRLNYQFRLLSALGSLGCGLDVNTKGCTSLGKFQGTWSE